MADSGFRGRVRGALGRVTSVRVSLKSRTVLEASILGLIVVIGVIFRIMPLQYGAYFSTEADTSFQYRVTEYVVKNGYSAWFTWHDSMSWYPWGRDIPHSSYPGLPFSAAFVYSLLQVLGFDVSVYYVSLFFPVLMAALTIIAIYFLGRDLGGGSVGLFAAFFMAVSAAYISRTSFGFFDDETIGIFSLVLISLFFLRSIEPTKPWIQSIVYAVLAGLSLGYLSASWGGARYAFGLLMLFVFIALLTNLYNRRYLVSYGVVIGLGSIIAIFVPKLGFSNLLSLDSVGVMAFFLFLVAYDVLRTRMGMWKLLTFSALSLAALFVALLALEYLGVINPLASKFLAVILPQTREASPIIQSIAEHKHAAWGVYFNDFGFTLSLALFSSYFVLRKVEVKRLFGLVFFLTAAYFAGSFVRLFLLLAIPVSLMAAYGLRELLSPFMSVASQGSIDKRTRRRKAMFGLSRELGVIFIVLIVMATIPTILSAADISNSPSTMAVTVPALVGGNYPQDWLQALNYMRDNLPDDAVVVSWWDYGYWIQTQGNKTTLADGSTINTTQIAQIGKIMMLNQTESLKILKTFNATHIVVYGTFNPSDQSQSIGLGDEAKWYWMVKIAGLNETEYIGSGNEQTVKYLASTLYSLMKSTANSKYFVPVFRSYYGWVLVYEINYPSQT